MATWRVIELVGGRFDGIYCHCFGDDWPDEWKAPAVDRPLVASGGRGFPNLGNPIGVPALTYRCSGWARIAADGTDVPLFVLMPPHGTGMALLSGSEKSGLL